MGLQDAANESKTKSGWHYRSGVLTWYDKKSYETLRPMSHVYFQDDFLGADLVIPAWGADESGCKWAKMIVGGAPPLVAKVADAGSGVVSCTLTNDDQKQDAGIGMDDNRQFDVSKNLVFEARVKVSVTPTLLAEAVWGIMGDWVDGLDSVTYRAYFTADGSTTVYAETDDNATPTSATTGVVAGTTTWRVYRIDCSDVTDIKFYIDGTQVAAATTFPYAATGANAILQPYIGLYKSTGAGLGTVQVDYVRVWGDRT